MALKSIFPEMGRIAVRAFISEGSPLGPLKVMAKQIGRFFQIPIPSFRPFMVFESEANRKVLVYLSNANNGHPILWNIAAGRSCILLYHEHANHIWHDIAIVICQPGEIRRDQEAGSGLS